MSRRRRSRAVLQVDSVEALSVVRDLQKKFDKKRPTPANRASVIAYLAKKYSPDYLRSVGARLLSDVFKRTVPDKSGPVSKARDSRSAYRKAARRAGQRRAGAKPR